MPTTRITRLAAPFWFLGLTTCHPDPRVDLTTIRSAQWGFEVVVPAQLHVVFAGPSHGSCDTTTGTLTILQADTAPDMVAPDTVRVSFTRHSLAQLADTSGFILDESGAFWRAQGSERADSAIVLRGPGWEALEGGGVSRFERPDHAPDEAAVEFDDFLLSLARFDRPGDCALVLRVYQPGGGFSADSLFRNVHLLPRRER